MRRWPATRQWLALQRAVQATHATLKSYGLQGAKTAAMLRINQSQGLLPLLGRAQLRKGLFQSLQLHLWLPKPAIEIHNKPRQFSLPAKSTTSRLCLHQSCCPEAAPSPQMGHLDLAGNHLDRIAQPARCARDGQFAAQLHPQRQQPTTSGIFDSPQPFCRSTAADNSERAGCKPYVWRNGAAILRHGRVPSVLATNANQSATLLYSHHGITRNTHQGCDGHQQSSLRVGSPPSAEESPPTKRYRCGACPPLVKEEGWTQQNCG